MDSIKFVKAEYGKVKKELSFNYDPRPVELQRTTSAEIAHLQERLESLSEPAALSYVLPQKCAAPTAFHYLPLIPRSSKVRIQTKLINEPQPVSLKTLYKHGSAFL
jgi:hypothetical protein